MDTLDKADISEQTAHGGRTETGTVPDEGCLKFLRALARWQGIASPRSLGVPVRA